MCLSAMESITLVARWSTARAAFLSPASIAFLTFRIALRSLRAQGGVVLAALLGLTRALAG